MAARKLRVGVLMSPKREAELAAVTGLPNPLIDFVVLNSQTPYEDVRTCDCILHKLTDDFGKADTASQRRVDLLRRLEHDPHGPLLIDPLENVLQLASRKRIVDMTAAVAGTYAHTVVRPPKTVLVESADPAAILAAMRGAGMAFPVIIKPEVACGAAPPPACPLLAAAPSDHCRRPWCPPCPRAGTAESHEMLVALSEDGIAPLPSPVVVQEFVDHGSQLYKVYCAGDALHVGVRSSLPDAPAPSDAAPTSTLRFDSQQPLPSSFATAVSAPAAAVDAPPLSPFEVRSVGGLHEPELHQLLRQLRAATGLSLMGVDLLVQKGSGDVVVVDLNYFPKLAKFPDLVGALHALVTARCKARMAGGV